jgi:hypothetical protein
MVRTYVRIVTIIIVTSVMLLEGVYLLVVSMSFSATSSTKSAIYLLQGVSVPNEISLNLQPFSRFQ